MPRSVLYTIAALVVLAALGGFRYGLLVAQTTETDVINRYAAEYLAERERHGERGRLTDCVAYPGEDPGIWIVVSCGPEPHDPSRHYEFYVNRIGGLEYSGGPNTWGATPPRNADCDVLHVRCGEVRYEVDRFGRIREVTGDGA